MSEFLPFHSGLRSDENSVSVNAEDPSTILYGMTLCLAALDRAGAGIAAAHLALAIHHARVTFNLEEDGSGTD